MAREWGILKRKEKKRKNMPSTNQGVTYKIEFLFLSFLFFPLKQKKTNLFSNYFCRK